MSEKETEMNTERGEPAVPPPSAGSRFRLLQDGEIIQEGDQFLLDDAETWEPIGKDNSVGETWMVRTKYKTAVFMPARRKIHFENAKGEARR